MEASRHSFRNHMHYVDNGYSAKDPDRPGFNRLVSDIENDLVDTVVVYKYDRIARSLKDLILFLELLDKHSVNFISIAERFDTTTAIGRAMLNIAGTFAQFERDITVERVKDVMYDKARKGSFCGGVATYGYDIKNKIPVVNKEEAQIVKDIYNKFEEIRSLRGVVIWLNGLGYKTKRGANWGSSTVRRILANVFYIGYYTYGKKASGSRGILPKDKWLITKGDFEPIITKEQFNRIQVITRQKGYFPTKKYGEIYLLSGIMRCECGGAFYICTAKKKSTKKKYYYYKCSNRVDKGGAICRREALIKSEIEGYILNEIKHRARLHFDETETNKVLGKQKLDKSKERIKRLTLHMYNLRKRQGKLMSLYEDGSIAKEVLIKRMDKVTIELEETENQLENLKAETHPKQKNRRAELLQKINQLNGDFSSLSDEVKRDILRQLIKQIIVMRTGEVEIELYDL